MYLMYIVISSVTLQLYSYISLITKKALEFMSLIYVSKTRLVFKDLDINNVHTFYHF
jgi:hypothetical protein